MKDNSIKTVFQPVHQVLVANKDAKVGDVLPQILQLMAAGGRAVDKAIKDTNGKVRAILSSYSGWYHIVEGAGASEVREVETSTTGWNNMSQEEQGFYNAARLAYKKALRENEKANAHNTALLAEVAAGKVKPQDLQAKMAKVVDAEALLNPPLDKLTQGFKTRDECVAALKKQGGAQVL